MKIEDEVKGHFRNEYHKGAINLIYTVKHLGGDFLQTLKLHDLTEPQYNILRVLRGFRSQESISISFLKERMLDKNSDVSRIVDKLFEKKLVNRNENKLDRRQKEIEITEKGIELLKKLDHIEQFVDDYLKNLNSEEVVELNRLLDKIRD